MNWQGIIRTLILVFTGALAACGTESRSYRVQGDVWGFCQGMRTQLSSIDVYAFREDQVQPLFQHQKIDSIGRKTSVVFDGLPYSAAAAHTLTGPYSGYYAISLPAPGNYVIVAKCTDYRYTKAGKRSYWMLPISVSSPGPRTLDLDDNNTVDTIAAGKYKLEVD